MELRESGEDYLEAILSITQEKGHVRSIDVASRLSVTKPSVSRAMSLLRENGYILTDMDGSLTLTPLGHEVAERIYERHRILTRWLISLGVDEDIAAQDACRVEHDISPQTFACLKAHIEQEKA